MVSMVITPLIHEEVGLQCFIGDQACMRRVNAYQAREDEELRTALRSVCQIHKLPLAMIWVPCAHNGLRLLEVEFCSRRIGFRGSFLKASKLSHLRKGLVFRRALSSADMLYCSNISKLSIVEYPLVSYARLCKFSGWFTICLQNVYTGNDIYVLEFFLSPRSKDNENILTTLSSILGTIEEKFTTFRFASGKELGELIRVEDIQFQENQKIHSLQSIQATRDFSMSSIPSSVQSSASVANIWPGSQDACMGTINAKYDSDSNPSSDSDHSVEQSTTSVPMVTVKAKYASYTTKFKLSSPYRFVELQQKVTEWLNLPVGTYHVSYEDESVKEMASSVTRVFTEHKQHGNKSNNGEKKEGHCLPRMGAAGDHHNKKKKEKHDMKTKKKNKDGSSSSSDSDD
ncbi:hypothetical protein Vadar_027927 [Vaccinium darrowii]|uniref:Uncharacterized protein n=1 Tax=Vaccinium darrowii TaxID=229202 RepID=A0ACB7XKS8_9ERIC|nr:hypothetical protein Vadar_027927 [Vaccinium darrowii]